ncbi:MAG: BrnA antitoxin family protein [Gammaproteobacteria bacterium]
MTDTWISQAGLYHGAKLVRRGRPKLANPRQLLSLRLPSKVIARWKSTAPGWQTRMAEALERAAPKSRRATGQKVFIARLSSGSVRGAELARVPMTPDKGEKTQAGDGRRGP